MCLQEKMKKEHIANSLIRYGEVIINYRSVNSKKLKYIVCTLDFDNDYIRTKPKPKEQADRLLLFCWDSDTYKQLDPELVTSIEPLNKVLQEKNG